MRVNESCVLFSAISAWKQGLETLLFFPRCWPGLCSGRLLDGETLPKLGQAAQKQMRSDTGAKEYSPEPPWAHITKCSTLRLLCSMSTLHVEIMDMETARHVKMGWMGVCIFIFVCLWMLWREKLVWVRFKSMRPGVSTSCVYCFHFIHLYLMVVLVVRLPKPHGGINWQPFVNLLGDKY